jgi:hypothetical protein
MKMKFHVGFKNKRGDMRMKQVNMGNKKTIITVCIIMWMISVAFFPLITEGAESNGHRMNQDTQETQMELMSQDTYEPRAELMIQDDDEVQSEGPPYMISQSQLITVKGTIDPLHRIYQNSLSGLRVAMYEWNINWDRWDLVAESTIQPDNSYELRFNRPLPFEGQIAVIASIDNIVRVVGQKIAFDITTEYLRSFGAGERFYNDLVNVHDFDFFGADDELMGVFSMAQIVNEVYHWFYESTGYKRSLIDIVFPNKYGYKYVYRPDTDRIYINSDGYSQHGIFAIRHEYAHAIQNSCYFIPASTWGVHYLWDESNRQQALMEGWAEFSECAFVLPHGDAWQVILFHEIYGVPYYENLENNRWERYGEDENKNVSLWGDDDWWDGMICEGSVASIFWDIYDGHLAIDHPTNMVSDNIDIMAGNAPISTYYVIEPAYEEELELGIAPIWDVMANYDPYPSDSLINNPMSIDDFIDGWFARGHGNDHWIKSICYNHGLKLEWAAPGAPSYLHQTAPALTDFQITSTNPHHGPWIDYKLKLSDQTEDQNFLRVRLEYLNAVGAWVKFHEVNNDVMPTVNGYYTYNVHVNALPDGTWPIRAVVDDDMMETTSQTVSVTVDTIKPTSAVTASGAYWRNTSPIVITATASNGLSGVKDVSLWYQYRATTTSAWGSWVNFDTDTYGADGWSWSFPWPLGQGHYQFYSIATDNAGNIEAVPVQPDYDAEYGYDLTAPTITSFIINSGIATTTSRSVTLSISASDAAGDVSMMRFTNENQYGPQWHTVTTNVGSTHPVLPGVTESTVITRTEATSMKVYFNVIDTRPNLDYVYVKDKNNIVIDTFTGQYTNGVWSSSITGNFVKIEIVCNLFDTFGSWGFEIGSYQYYAEEWSTWETFSSSKNWALSEGYGSKTVYCQVNDIFGYISNDASDQITFQPFGTSIIINGNADYTNTESVGLTLSSDTTPVSMRFTNIENPTPSWHFGGDLNTNNPRELWWRSELLIPTVESPHPYSANLDQSWWVNAPNSATQMKLIFGRIGDQGIKLWEHPTVTDVCDSITLCKGNLPTTDPKYNDAYDSFRGYHTYVESLEIPSNSVRIRLQSEIMSPGDYGFVASQINWRDDGLFYPNGYDNTWSISKAGALKMKIYFSRVDIGANDILTVWDSSGTLDTIVGPFSQSTTYSVTGVSGNTIWVRLQNMNENTRGWGIDINRWDYYYDSSWTDWEPWASSKSWTLADGADGTRIVWLQAKDSGGNTALDYDEITLDRTAPNIPTSSISTTSPYIFVNGNILSYSDMMGNSPQPFTIQGTASNGGSGLWIATSSSAFGDSPPDDFSPGSWSFGYSIIGADAGSGTIIVTVYDNAGNTNTVPFNYIEDNVGPTTILSFPPNNFVTASSTPAFTWASSDIYSGISNSYRLEISKDSVILYDGIVTTNSIVCPITLNDGLYYWKVISTDNVGNSGQSPTYSFIVDTTSPIAQITSPSSGATVNGIINIQGTATDSNIRSYKLEIGRSTAPSSFELLTSSTSSTTGILYTLDTFTLINTVYTLKLTVEDQANHISSQSSIITFSNPDEINKLQISSIGTDDLRCSFFLNSGQLVTAWVEDSLGGFIKSIHQNIWMSAGTYPSGVIWDWTDSTGTVMGTGDYVIKVDSTTAPLVSLDIHVRNAPIITVSSGYGTTTPTFTWTDTIGNTPTWHVYVDGNHHATTTTASAQVLCINEHQTIEIFGEYLDPVTGAAYVTKPGSIEYSAPIARIHGTISAPGSFWYTPSGMHSVQFSATVNINPSVNPWKSAWVGGATVMYPSLPVTDTTIEYEIFLPSGLNTRITASLNGPSQYMGSYWRTHYGIKDPATESLLDSYDVFFDLQANNDYEINLEIEWRPSWSPGGACPYVATWNGEEYVIDNNILGKSDYISDASPDITDHFRLTAGPELLNGVYPITVGELGAHYSIFDSFELLLVDHNPGSNVIVDTGGNVRTYSELQPPISCTDKWDTDRLPDVSGHDQVYDGFAGDWLEMDFGLVESNFAKFVLNTDAKPEPGGGGDTIRIEEEIPGPIVIQILDEWGQWLNVSEVYPRHYWHYDMVDISPYVNLGSPLKVRLNWESFHKLAFVGLDTSEDEEIEIHIAPLVRATDEALNNVTEQVKYSDGRYTDMMPDQYITLDYGYVELTKGERDFILVSKGYYGINDGKPTASAVPLPPTSHTYEPIYFDARDSEASDASVSSYFYYFGDGTTSGWLSDSITYHEYTDEGVYNVTLIVKDDNVPYKIGITTTSVTIFNRNPEPVLEIYQDVEISLRITGRKGNSATIQIYEDDVLIIEESVTRTPDNPNAEMAWVSLHKYLNRDYRVVLLYDSTHLGANPTWLNFTSGEAYVPFFMYFSTKNGCHQIVSVPSSYLSDVVAINPHYTFDASGSYDIDGEIVSYVWNFDDNSISDAIFTEHTYSEPGQYIVMLTIIDDDDAIARETLVVEVCQP